jgi:hypothetical protein
MITALKDMLPQIERWPYEDQEALLEAARSIEAERTGTFHASDADLAAIDRGLDDARAGRFASDDAAAKVRAKFRPG